MYLWLLTKVVKHRKRQLCMLVKGVMADSAFIMKSLTSTAPQMVPFRLWVRSLCMQQKMC